MTDVEKRQYTPRTLCEVCANACGGCSWSRQGEQKPVDGWDAVRHDLQYGESAYSGQKKEFYEESYIVLHCPEFELEPHNEWAYKKFKPENIRATLSSRARGFKRDKITGKKLEEGSCDARSD